MNTIKLPTSIEIKGRTIPLTWAANENLDGFIAEIKCGIPVENFNSSDDCEFEIWQNNNLKSDVYLDGSGVVYFKI